MKARAAAKLSSRRKISRAVAAIKQGLQKELFLGNSGRKTRLGICAGVRRRDVANCATRMKETISCWLQAKRTPCVSSSKRPFRIADLDWKEFVKHDPRYERPAEVDLLIGDPSKAKKILGWEPKVRFHELVRIMVDADMELLSRETPRKHLGKCRELRSRSLTAVRRQRRACRKRCPNSGQNSLNRHYHRRIGRFDADSVSRCGRVRSRTVAPHESHASGRVLLA